MKISKDLNRRLTTEKIKGLEVNPLSLFYSSELHPCVWTVRLDESDRGVFIV